VQAEQTTVALKMQQHILITCKAAFSFGTMFTLSINPKHKPKLSAALLSKQLIWGSTAQHSTAQHSTAALDLKGNLGVRIPPLGTPCLGLAVDEGP